MPSLFHVFNFDEQDGPGSKKAGVSPRPLACPAPSADLLH